MERILISLGLLLACSLTTMGAITPNRSALPKISADDNTLAKDTAAWDSAAWEKALEMVTVDGQDNIKVNNSSTFKVYVNGKPNNMMSNNPSEVLKSMPANSIKKIEVITNPGPKYDAEGVGGILNIITVGRGMEGYTLTVGTNVSTNGVVGGNGGN